jgi:4-hydroxybenzoate polyprenyltransferase
MSAERRFYIALALYAVLGVLVWTTLGYAPIRIQDREIDLRVIPSLILGMFALRTILFRQAERMRAKEKS